MIYNNTEPKRHVLKTPCTTKFFKWLYNFHAALDINDSINSIQVAIALWKC